MREIFTFHPTFEIGSIKWVKIFTFRPNSRPSGSNWVKIHKSVEDNQPTRFLQLLHFPSIYEISSMESWLYHYNSLPVKFQLDWTTFQIIGVRFVSSFGLSEKFSVSAQILKLGL
jgi:hypothetical protein